jgi:formylglycine-generating enzyme required for sulfatase activity
MKLNFLSRMSCGGGWYYYGESCRVAFRNYFFPDFRDIRYGFRVVL